MASRQTLRKSRVQLPAARSQPSRIHSDSSTRERQSRFQRQSRYQRQSRFHRQSRVSIIAATDDDAFRIRKPLNMYVREDLKREGRKTYFQRVFVFARNLEKQEDKEPSVNPLMTKDEKQEACRLLFQNHFNDIEDACDKLKFIRAQLSGFFVCMEVYSFLVIEGDEDMMANFFAELSAIHDELWQESKVFQVEDNIGETYFSRIHYHHSPAINTNEKFVPSTVSDPTLMSVQHLYLKEKVIKLARTFSEQIEKDHENTETDNYALPADPYNRLLPEIQRIELVLKAHRFYRNVKDFALHYTVVPSHQDEEALFWPIHDSYTPLDIFERSEYDVNLTFGDYNSKGQNAENGAGAGGGEARDSTATTRSSAAGEGVVKK